jgi:PPP family 3-phenylpropionic acid transporter
MRAPSAAFWAFFATTYSGIAAITFIAVAFLDRGLTPAATGWLLGLLPVVQVVVQPLWGLLADLTGRPRALLTAACLGTAAAALGLWTASTSAALLAAMVAFTACRAAVLPIAVAMALAHLGPQETVYGRIRLWGSLGFSLAVFTLGATVVRNHPQRVLPVHAVVMLVAAALSLALPAPPGRLTAARLALRGAADPRLWRLCAAAVLAGAGLGVNNTFLAVFLRDLGGPAWTVGAAFAVAALGEVPLMAGMHRLIQRFGLSVMVGTGFLALPIRWTLYALLASPWPILPLQLLHSVTIAGLEVAGVVLVRTLTPPGWATTGQALYGAALMGLGPGIGTALAGTVYGWGGASTVFAASALAAGAGCLIFLRLPRAGPVGAISSPARASRTVHAGDGTPGG